MIVVVVLLVLCISIISIRISFLLILFLENILCKKLLLSLFARGKEVVDELREEWNNSNCNVKDTKILLYI